MPKYRQLHTKIIDSFDFNEMPDDFTRVVWMLLTLILDSEGRGIDNAGWIRSKMFPMRTDVTDEQIESAFNWLKKRKMIVRYSIKGRNYFCVPTFKLYQTRTEREAPSNIPAQNQEITPELVASKSGVSQEKGRLAESASASAYESESVLESKRPEIFTVYENEIGVLTPMIADALILAEQEYPPGWTAKAIQEASSNNKRSWKYAEAILKRWKIDGFQADNRKNGKTIISLEAQGYRGANE